MKDVLPERLPSKPVSKSFSRSSCPERERVLIRLPLTLIVITLFAILGPLIASSRFSPLALTIIVFCGAMALVTALVSDISEEEHCEKDNHLGKTRSDSLVSKIRTHRSSAVRLFTVGGCFPANI
ncbi:hypothetical protein [Noviherbaspirillum malthae]|uniref:hypothetical protein n=1 Tax=Noviherbaspirillum malthae TaxID=1260987 RepID=UPI00188E2ADE|nr:hypothetical protein [Noviherbaspirillum malthae]